MIIYLYALNRCGRSEVYRLVMRRQVFSFCPYDVGISISLLIVDEGERHEVLTLVNLERGMSRGISPAEPRGSQMVMIIQHWEIPKDLF
jgi:hypothetical protein